jgi:hypothetical protein
MWKIVRSEIGGIVQNAPQEEPVTEIQKVAA